jgi:hypothetical protein
MTYSSTIKTNRPYKPFWGLIFGLILVFGSFVGFLPNRALASNNYADDFLYYCGSNNYPRLSFHVITTFQASSGSSYPPVAILCNPDCYYGLYLVGLDTPHTFTAGNTYDFPFRSNNVPYPDACSSLNSSTNFTNFGNYDGWSPKFTPNFTDTEHYYFTELPSLTITFPEDDEELVANFYITGSFTQPTSTYQWLSAFVRVAGTQELFAVFNQAINATSGSMAIFTGGMAEGYVDIDIMMRSAGNDFYFEEDWTISNIHIVNDLPWVLPGWEDYPPTTAPPVYNPLDPTVYCTEHSTYATCTPMYYAMTDTFAPVLLSVGNNLVDFASKFTPSNASSTGNQLGQSILIIRSYITNINSFFSDFPVANFLLLYLIALVVVIVLRLVKGLIGLFKI